MSKQVLLLTSCVWLLGNLGLRSAINLIYSKLIEGKLQASSPDSYRDCKLGVSSLEASSLKLEAKQKRACSSGG
jgi:hypothetical protein